MKWIMRLIAFFAAAFGFRKKWGQAPPKANDRRPVWELVIADMQSRDQFGREKYGVPLQAFNGRDALKDIYEEQLDQVVYFRQLLEERDEGEPPNTREMPASIRVNARDLAHIISENTRLYARVDELLTDNSRLVEERRAVRVESGNARLRAMNIVGVAEVPVEVIPARAHEYYDRCGSDLCEGMCAVCNLAVCKKCGLFEGCLTTDCPNENSYKSHSDKIYAGEIDFFDGTWVEQCSAYSPRAFDEGHPFPVTIPRKP